MRQLALQIQNDSTPTLANFVSGRNGEAVAALRAVVDFPAREALVYLWGPPGCGKTHLLAALARALDGCARPARLIAGGQAQAADLAGECLLVDDVDRLSPALAERLFHAWNRIRDDGGLLVCAGQQAPAGLALAPELASRLAWGAVYRLQPLDDEEKMAALRTRAAALGMPAGDDALRYLLAHARRDLPSLCASLARLDRLSLATRRAITIPLVRELLQHGGDDSLETLCD